MATRFLASPMEGFLYRRDKTGRVKYHDPRNDSGSVQWFMDDRRYKNKIRDHFPTRFQKKGIL